MWNPCKTIAKQTKTRRFDSTQLGSDQATHHHHTELNRTEANQSNQHSNSIAAIINGKD